MWVGCSDKTHARCRFCEGIGIVATGSETACCSFVTPRGVVAGSGVCTAFHVAAAELISLGGAAATTTAMATLCVGRGGQRMPHVLMVVLDDAGFNGEPSATLAALASAGIPVAVTRCNDPV